MTALTKMYQANAEGMEKIASAIWTGRFRHLWRNRYFCLGPEDLIFEVHKETPSSPGQVSIIIFGTLEVELRRLLPIEAPTEQSLEYQKALQSAIHVQSLWQDIVRRRSRGNIGK